MLALRYAAILTIAVWVGGLVALGAIAAPAIFDVVAAHTGANGRVFAGAIFGEALRRFHLVGYACGAVILLTLITRAVLGPRPRRFAIRFSIAAIMLASTLYSGLVTMSAIERLQQDMGVGVAASTLPADDFRRLSFNRLHGQSRLLHMVPLVGGLLLIFWELRD